MGAEKTKHKIRRSMSGKDNPMYGKKHSEETIRKIKEARKKQGATRKGVPCSEETKKRKE